MLAKRYPKVTKIIGQLLAPGPMLRHSKQETKDKARNYGKDHYVMVFVVEFKSLNI